VAARLTSSFMVSPAIIVGSAVALTWVYRGAMAELLTGEDLQEITGRRELYRRFSRMSETLVEVAERIWYAAVKEP